MQREEHMFYECEAEVPAPFATLVSAIGRALELATPATRAPVHAGWAHYYQREFMTAHGMSTLISPDEEHEAWLETDGQANVDGLFAYCLRRHGPPEIGISMRWVPNFQWCGRDTFSMLGLNESSRHEGHAACHYLHLSANTALHQSNWILAHLAFPVSGPGDDFEALFGELEQRLGLPLKRRRWLVRTPVGKRRWKLSRPFRNGSAPA